jgi:hypothetical protein
MVTAVIVGMQGQTFEAAFTSGTAENLFAGVAGVGALVATAITVGIVIWASAAGAIPASAGTAAT